MDIGKIVVWGGVKRDYSEEIVLGFENEVDS